MFDTQPSLATTLHLVCGLVVLASGCGGVSTAPDAGDSDAPSADAPPQTCDPLAAFGTPVVIPGFESIYPADEPRLTPDELAIYFGAILPSDSSANIYFATRATTADPFGPPTKIAAASDEANDYGAWISADQLTLLFQSSLTGVSQLYVTTRASTLADFGAAAPIANIGSGNPADHDVSPFVAADGALWFGSTRTGGQGGYDIWRAPRAGAGFGTPAPVDNLGSPANDFVPVLSADQLTVYLDSSRAGGTGASDIWRAQRASVGQPFGAPVEVTELDTARHDIPGWLSPDSCRLYFQSDRDGPMKIWVATRTP